MNNKHRTKQKRNQWVMQGEVNRMNKELNRDRRNQLLKFCVGSLVLGALAIAFVVHVFWILNQLQLGF